MYQLFGIFFLLNYHLHQRPDLKAQGDFSGCKDVSHGQLAPEKAAPLIPVPSFFANAILRSVGQIAAFLGYILADIGHLPLREPFKNVLADFVR